MSDTTPSLDGPFYPTDELVAVAWLSQRVPGLTSADVATTLPRAAQGGSVTWLERGFVQVQAISTGRSLVDIPVRRPVLQVDCWASSAASSSKVPWNKAARLVELVRVATELDSVRYGRAVEMPTNYLGARVQSVYLATDPTRVTGDPSAFARFTLDLAIDWVRQ